MMTFSRTQYSVENATNASLADQIRGLGACHGISCPTDPHGPWANKMAELAGEEVRLDQVESTLLELSRIGVLTSEERLALHRAYLDELNRHGSSIGHFPAV
ncbi:hypothetical protein [Methylovirgula sp. 4M-Z18]|nr:hypothetical protein [Methylovirgula sp. 4M-Z18]